MSEKLFEPIRICGIEVENRIVLPTMGMKMAAEDGNMTQQIIDYQVTRAEGGCGLNLLKVCAVHASNVPQKFLVLHNDSYIPPHKALCDAIYEAGGKYGVQPWQRSLAASMDPKVRILVASDLHVYGHIISTVDVKTIEEVVTCSGVAAKRAAKVGYDCVEFHCGRNYLPHSFLSPAFNHREDVYGGIFERRYKLPLDCVRAIRQNIPRDIPLLIRLDAQDDYLESGLTIEGVIAFCRLAKEAGVDILDIPCGNTITAGLKYEVPPIDTPEDFNVDNCARIRGETGILCVTVRHISTPQLTEETLGQNKMDMVVMGRTQLADASFCVKVKEGRLQKIVCCIDCNQGCYSRSTDPAAPSITCIRNPYLGKEAQDVLVSAQKPKRALIAGGGVAGLGIVCILKWCSCQPIVCKASDELSDQSVTAGKAPKKIEMKDAVLSYEEKAKYLGTLIHFNTPADVLLTTEGSWDGVIFTTGAESIYLPVPEANREYVHDSHDILNGKATASGHVVIAGGGLVGVGTVEYLSEQEVAITTIEMLGDVAKDLGTLCKIYVMESLYMHHIKTAVNTSAKAVVENGVLVENEGVEQVIPCDSIVMAAGARVGDHEALIETREKEQTPYRIIGDAKRARRALQTIAEAYEIVCSL